MPNNYEPRHVARLVISALAGVGRGTDVVRVRLDDSGEPRRGELYVKGPLSAALTIAGKVPTCTAQLNCSVDLELKEWMLDLSPLFEEEISQVRVVPWIQLADTGRLDQYFDRIGINNVWLPSRKKEGEPRQHTLAYLFDHSAFILRLESRDAAAAVTVPEVASHLILVKRLRSSTLPYKLEFASPASADGSQAGGTQQVAVVPPSRSMLHLVLEPRGVPGWPAERVAQRLKKSLEANEFRAILSAGGHEIPAENQGLEVAGSKVVVWSGERKEGWSVQLDHLPSSMMPEQPGPPAQRVAPDGPIGANHWVSRIPITIPPVLLSDSWQFSIKAVNRIYGKDKAIQTNELCEFKLVNRADGSALGRLTRDGEVLHSSESVNASKVMDARLELEVTPTDGSARCAQQSIAVPSVAYQWVNNAATATATVTLTPRGRWFLALYAPQSIGAGMSGQASDQAILEARNQITDSMTTWLEAARKRHFADSDPSKAALGFDLALVSGADADVSATTPFEESSVLLGQYRQPKTLQFKFDNAGEARLDAFFRSARGSGSAPSFDALERTVVRYSNLFGQLDPNGKPPIVVYVGGGQPNPGSCKDWARTTATIRSVRVFSLAFVSSSASGIRESLGADSGAVAENTGSRTLGYSCQGESDSTLLFAPFPDLVARSPDIALQRIIDRLDVWMARN